MVFFDCCVMMYMCQSEVKKPKERAVVYLADAAARVKATVGEERQQFLSV